MGLFGNTEKAKARKLSKILGYTRKDEKKTLDQLEQEFGAKVRALPTDYTKKDLKRIVKEEKGDTLDSVLFNPTVQDEAGNFVRTDIPEVDVNDPSVVRPDLPPGTFYADDVVEMQNQLEELENIRVGDGDPQINSEIETLRNRITEKQNVMDEAQIRAVALQIAKADPNFVVPPPGQPIDEATRLRVNDFLQYNQADLFADEVRALGKKVSNIPGVIPPLPEVPEIETVPINQQAVEANNTFFTQLATEAQQEREANLSPEEQLKRTILSSIGEEPELNEAELKRAKTRALVNAFGNLLQAGVGLQQMQAGNYFQAKPLDNSEVLANLDGVYDDYYKELADYRDDKKEAMLKIATIDANQIAIEREQEQKDKDQALQIEENKLDRESRENIAKLNRETQLEIANLRAEGDSKKDDKRSQLEKDLLNTRIEAEKELQKSTDLNNKRILIADAMKSLTTQYGNLYDTYKENNELIENELDETKKAELMKKNEEIVANLNAINAELETYRGYSNDLLTTGEINYKTNEEDDVTVSETENATIKALQEEITRLQNQINTPAQGSLEQVLQESRNEIGNILTNELNFLKSNLGSVQLNNLESLLSLQEKINDVKKNNYSSEKRLEYFGDEKVKVDSIYKLSQRLDSLINKMKEESVSDGNEYTG